MHPEPQNFKSRVQVPLIAAFLLFVCVACGKTETQRTLREEQRVARYATSVYEKMGGSKDRGQRVATLAKGEQVALKKLEFFAAKNGKNEEYALVELHGGKRGYVAIRHLALKAVLIIQDAVRVYKRPTVSSGLQSWGPNHLNLGLVAFVHTEDYNQGDWLDISGHKDGKLFRGWVQVADGIGSQPQLVGVALRLEQTVRTLKNPKVSAEQRQNAVTELKSLSKEKPPIAALAAELLTQFQNANLETAEPPITEAPTDE